MTAADRLRHRLGFVVQGIDAGTFRTPEGAADAILDTLASHYGPHRAELVAWLVDAGVLAPAASSGPFECRLYWLVDP